MSSRRGSNKPNSGGASQSPKGKRVEHGSSGVDNNDLDINQLSHNVADISLGSSQGEGDWEVFTKKQKNRTGASKACWPPSSNPSAWGKTDTMQRVGIGHGGAGNTAGAAWQTQPAGGAWQAQPADAKRNGGRGIAKTQSANRAGENSWGAPPSAVPPPLQRGWNWAARAGASQPQDPQDSVNNDTPFHQEYAGGDNGSEFGVSQENDNDDDDDEDDVLAEESDDDIMDDDFDSDDSVKSHGTRKQNRWFKPFFEALDKLGNDQANELSRQWHCPACANGPGAINWYRGLQPLMAHAKTKGANRVKLHREFAEILDEELYRRGASVIPSGESFGKWEGLKQTVKDHEIVWPPMVIIMNTKLEQDENEKWIGMGNQELLEYFSQYRAVKARHSYGPQGHRGMSLLIFEGTAMGYHEAERLHKHFSDERTDREAWNKPSRRLFYPGGKRQLYGFMACKEDMDFFNQHSQGKTRLKYEVRSYLEMVDKPLKQMEEDTQKLKYWETKAERERRASKVLQENYGQLSENYRKALKEGRIVRERTQEYHNQTKEQMDSHDMWLKDAIGLIHQTLEENERAFEEALQEEREKVKAMADSKSNGEPMIREEKIAKFIQEQDEGIKVFEADREKVIKEYEEKKADMKRRHMEEEVQLEEQLKSSLTALMGQYAPQLSEKGSSSK